MSRYMWVFLAVIWMVLARSASADALDVEIVYIEQQPIRPALRSTLVKWHNDDGRLGARLGLADNQTTGKFLQQEYILTEYLANEGDDIFAIARGALDGGAKIVVLNLPDEAVLQVADMQEAGDDLLVNAGAADSTLREANCRANLFHTLPSRTMLADALMQFFVKRRWTSLFLIEGQRPGDAKFAAALRKSAAKFRLNIDHDRPWLVDRDIRRNASQEVPVFTQARNYDVVLVADEDHDFGQYVPYNTWLPRPVAGSAGLRATAWSPVLEQWGALQLQSRFEELAGRGMTTKDYAAWAAVRSIGEAVTRTGSNQPSEITKYFLSDQFALAGFKGAKLSFRSWNGQLRQPIPLVQSEALVALAPIEGFLHQQTELDTLGSDEPENRCPENLGG